MENAVVYVVFGGFLFAGFAPDTFMRFYRWGRRVAAHLASL